MSRLFFAVALSFTFAALVLANAAPATAQVFHSPSTKFLKAVKEGDGTIVNELLASGGEIMANTKGGDRDESALHIVVRRGDQVWTRFLIQKGARPDVLDKEGLSPLMIAVFNDDVELVRILTARGASVDFTNARGETALIRAVQLRKTAMVRELVSLGADPDVQDYVLGMSARDYAERDNRSRDLADALEPVSKDVGDVDESIGPAFPVEN